MCDAHKFPSDMFVLSIMDVVVRLQLMDISQNNTVPHGPTNPRMPHIVLDSTPAVAVSCNTQLGGIRSQQGFTQAC